MLQGLRAPSGADRSEPLPEAQPLPYRPHRCYRPHPRRPFSFQRPNIDTFAPQMTLKGGHDPFQLAGLAQSGHLPQP